MALSGTVSAIFSIRYWHDLKIWVRGHSRSWYHIHQSHTSSYSSSIVTMAIYHNCIILEICTKATNYQLFDIGRKVPIFIARQHNDARYWYSKSVRPSLSLSVRPLHTVAQPFYTIVLPASNIFTNSYGVTPCWGTKYRLGTKISRFWTNNSLYLANDTRYIAILYFLQRSKQ